MTTVAQRERRRQGLRSKEALAAVLVAVCFVVAVGAVVVLAARAPDAAPVDATAVALPAGPSLLFRGTGEDAGYGYVAALAMGQPPGPAPVVTGLACERVAFGGGRGICLTQAGGFGAPAEAVLLDEDLRPGVRVPLAGAPSRARVSPDGRYAAVTVFVTGHSYADGAFSTETVVLDAATGERVVQLEELQVERDGRPFSAVDFNFWGVTFAGGTRFYATLSTGGTAYLIEGDVAARTARVLRPGVECPSLSPDGTRIAYKFRVEGPGPLQWRLHVLDLASGEDIALADDRPVDDQAFWLDDDTVAYGLPRSDQPTVTDIWQVPADGEGSAELLVEGGWSPALRP